VGRVEIQHKTSLEALKDTETHEKQTPEFLKVAEPMVPDVLLQFLTKINRFTNYYKLQKDNQ
jgi:hypothetical protein